MANACIPLKACLKPQEDCDHRGTAGGWSKIWLINTEDLEGPTFENNSNGLPKYISKIGLRTGAQVYEAKSDKQLGTQLNMEGSSDGGPSHSITGILAFTKQDAELRAWLFHIFHSQKELCFIGKHRNGKFYAHGFYPDQGVPLSEYSEDNGRVADDGITKEYTFSTTLSYGAIEFLYDNGSTPAGDYAQRLKDTQTWLDSVTACPLLQQIGVNVTDTMPYTYTSGVGDTNTVNFELFRGSGSDKCTDDVTIELLSSLPSGISINGGTLPTISNPTTTSSFQLDDDGTAAVGTYEVYFRATTTKCGSDTFVVQLEVTN